MTERFKEIRLSLKLTQEEFGEKIGIKSRAHISALESGKRTITDRIISDVCREFNVNEEWLRNGTGEMFIEPDTFSLDEYAKQHSATDFDLEIVKAYFEMPKELREGIKKYFISKTLPQLRAKDENTATKEKNIGTPSNDKLLNNGIDIQIKNSGNTDSPYDDVHIKIKEELNNYEQELIAESKGEILSVSERQEGA